MPVPSRLPAPDLSAVFYLHGFASGPGSRKGGALSVKITWVIAREDFDWKIVSHHVSSKAPLI